MTNLLRPVVLSGGSGTRLWPLSRKNHPKQFLPLADAENSFIGALRTAADRTRFAPPFVVGNTDHRFLILDSLTHIGIEDARVFLEPMGRNTAIAALIATIAEMDTQSSGLHLVMPSDHTIADKAAFARALDIAAPAARSGKIVLFGIEPIYPETGFGYISPSQSEDDEAVRSIATFHEKPDAKTATNLIENGALWNSGIFLYDPATLLSEAERLMPDDLALCRQAIQTARKDFTGLQLSADLYAQMGDHSFDRAIMEKTDKGAVVACRMGWSDLGSWQSLWQAADKDSDNNALYGPTITHVTDGCYIRSEGPSIATVGVHDLTVVATKDAVLVASRAQSQNVKFLVDKLYTANQPLAFDHPRVLRPWGFYESLAQSEHFHVKRIVVLPGKSLSLQKHLHRAEHWVVVTGIADIECDDIQRTLMANESFFVPIGAKHRLSNRGEVDLHVIEVQSGDYIGEDDIVRFDDPYGRDATGRT